MEAYHESQYLNRSIMCGFQRVEKKGSCCYFHYHEHIELIYPLGGVYSIWLNGKYIEFTKGDLIVINSCELHEINCVKPSTGGGYYCIRILPSVLYESTDADFEIKYIVPFLSNHKPPVRLIPHEHLDKTNMCNLIQDLDLEMEHRKYAYEYGIRANTYRIVLHILRYWDDNNMTTISDTDIDLINKIQPAINYVNQHYNEPVTAESMAELSNLSYSYFSRIFRKVAGKNFSEYLNHIRINESAKLLATTDMNITEIAMSVGFSSSSYYIQQFRKTKKISPKQYRKQFFNY